MKVIFIIITMIFCHIIADYNLQGWLASAKQKSWWEKNAPDSLYKYDYIAALFMHSFSWSFLIMIPLFVANGFIGTSGIILAFAVNVIVHMIVDNTKANTHKINLWQDQVLHMIQIIGTALILTAN